MANPLLKVPEGPKEFYETVVGREFGDQVAICNYPHLEMNRHYGIRVDHRIIDQPYRKFINLPIAKLTQYALEIVLSDRLLLLPLCRSFGLRKKRHFR